MSDSYLLTLAYQRFESGHLDGAIATLRQLLGVDPECGEAHALLAICLLSMRRLHAARREAHLALAAEPLLELGHYAAAHVAMAGRQFKLAHKHLLQLLDLDPMQARYHRALAELHGLRGKPTEQFSALSRALELEPESPDSLADLAEYHRHRGDFSRAEHFASQALQVRADHRGAIVTMGHLLLRSGQLEAARDHAVWALQQDSNDVSALYLMSAIKARSNPFMGLWWRYNSWMAELGPTRSIIVLLVMFVVYRVAVIGTTQQGYAQVAQAIEWLWLGLVAYSFAGPQIFKRSLDKELARVELSKDF